jgi:DNA-binding transcriptional ArsR family regulator
MAKKEQAAAECVKQLKVLADEGRLRIIQLLQAGPLAVSDIAQLLETEIANVSHDLRILHRHALVQTQRQGKHIYYSLTPDFLQQSRGKRHLNLGCCRLEMPEETA